MTPLLRFTHLHQPPRAAALPPAPSGISSSTPGRPLRQTPALSPASRRASSSSSTVIKSKPPARSSTSGVTGSSTAGAGGSPLLSSSGSSVAAGKELRDVTAAKFFRMDEFVVLGSGNQVLLYRWVRLVCSWVASTSRSSQNLQLRGIHQQQLVGAAAEGMGLIHVATISAGHAVMCAMYNVTHGHCGLPPWPAVACHGAPHHTPRHAPAAASDVGWALT